MGSTAEDVPEIREGPVINGKPTTLTVLNKTQLTSSPYLIPLINTANLAFRTSHASRPELRMSTAVTARIASPEYFLQELSDDPGTFIPVVTYAGEEEVLATGTVRRYFGLLKTQGVQEGGGSGSVSDEESPWTRTLDVEVGCVEWEVKMMAVRPELQGQGVAGWILRCLEEEVLRRSRVEFETRRRDGGVKVEGEVEVKGSENFERVKMVLCTPREILGEFYAKRGYVKEYEVARGGGMNYHIIFMSKILGTLV